MKRHHRKLTVFVSALALGLFCSVAAFVAVVNLVGRDCVVNDTWLPDVLKVKRLIASRTPSPRILVVAGSGALFGVDSKVISEALDIPVVNMALHAALPFEFYCEEMRRQARSGDIVVMPLEISHFYRESLYDKVEKDFPISLLFGCAHCYQRALPPGYLARFYGRFGLEWICRNLRGQTYRADAPVRNLEQTWKSSRNEPGYGGYSYHGLTERGDMLVSRPTLSFCKEQWDVLFNLAPTFLETYRSFVAEMNSRGVRVLLVWSNLLWYPEYGSFESWRGMLAANGVELLGRPEAFSFPRACYYDTQYHLNAFGAALNAREIAKVVGEAIGRKPRFPDDAPAQVVFAECLRESFPGSNDAAVYASGVRVPTGGARLHVGIPRSLSGRSVLLNLVVRCSATNAPVAVACCGEKLPVDFSVRGFGREMVIRLPRHLTKGGAADLDMELSEPVGFERMTVLGAVPDVRLISGFAGEGTEGERSEFEMAVPDEVRGRDAILVLSVIPNDERMKVFCGERELAGFSFDGSPKELRIPVPASCTDGDCVRFLLCVEGARSPLERGINPETRKLGPRIMSMKLVPAR